MNVGILGSGTVAQSLGAGFLARGDSVMLGTRDVAKLSQWQQQAGASASVGSFGEAARFGEIVVLATHGMVTPGLLQDLGAEPFDGKTVIDATNAIGQGKDGPVWAIGFSDSLGEQNQRAIPGARVVKAFNTVGAEFMVKPKFENGPGDMFMAGDDVPAKAQVAEIVRAFGWHVADIGGIEAARLLEPMAMVWIEYGRRTGRFDHAFKFIHAAT